MKVNYIAALAFTSVLVFQVNATTINFDQFTDSDLLTNQIPGLTFSNTIVLAAGVSLNEQQFPPHSGSNVASDNGGPITITFASPITLFDGFFTYAAPLTLNGFDDTGTLVSSNQSQFLSNLALGGDPGSHPNEFLELSSTRGISQVVISGLPSGGSLAMDDISFQATPEPQSWPILCVALGTVLFRNRQRRP